MLTTDLIMSFSKDELQEASKALNNKDILQLVEWLNLKDDDIRYRAFLLLQSRSSLSDDVYVFWDTFLSKLKSDNSYQRSIGLMLLSENAKWDTENKTENIIDEYLMLLEDEKPVTIRQCIQSLEKIVTAKPDLNDKIASRLISFDLFGVKETMRKSILLDILNVLLMIRKTLKKDEIEGYIFNALSGEILDKRTKKKIESLL